MLSASNPNVVALVDAVGEEALSIKEMMERLGIKHRPSFLYNHLRPAISEGYVAMLYPDKPKHPCQKYLLTTKGVALRRELDEKMS